MRNFFGITKYIGFILLILIIVTSFSCSSETDGNDPDSQENNEPIIHSVLASSSTIKAYEQATLTCCDATDEDKLSITWVAAMGSFPSCSTRSSVR